MAACDRCGGPGVDDSRPAGVYEVIGPAPDANTYSLERTTYRLCGPCWRQAREMLAPVTHHCQFRVRCGATVLPGKERDHLETHGEAIAALGELTPSSWAEALWAAFPHLGLAKEKAAQGVENRYPFPVVPDVRKRG